MPLHREDRSHEDDEHEEADEPVPVHGRGYPEEARYVEDFPRRRSTRRTSRATTSARVAGQALPIWA